MTETKIAEFFAKASKSGNSRVFTLPKKIDEITKIDNDKVYKIVVFEVQNV